MNRPQLTSLILKMAKKQGPGLLDERDSLADVLIHLIEKTLTEHQLRTLFDPKSEVIQHFKPTPTISSMVAEAFTDEPEESGLIFEGVFGDWKAHAGVEGEDVSRERYNVRVVSSHNSGAMWVDLESISFPGFGASLGIDITDGLPVVRCSNIIDGDNVLSVHFNKTEIAVCPDSSTEYLQQANSEPYFPHLPKQNNMMALESDASVEFDCRHSRVRAV